MPCTHIARTAGTAGIVLACALPLAAQTPHAGHQPAPQQPAPQQPAPAAAQQATMQRPAGQAVASPRDSASATVGGARVLVDYGRPSKRNRQIFGALVPYNQVWRTGANAATTLVTSQALQMGDVKIPAGTYTLYTIPTESAWTLIVNRQTKQWGTEYDKTQDLARIPMRATRGGSPVEQFTIAVVPRGATGGAITMAWDTVRAEVPFSVAR